MKTLITAIAISMTLFTTTVQASPKFEFCQQLANLANTAMTKRLEGVSLQAQMTVAKNMDLGDEKLENVLMLIITEAYETPAYSTESVKQKAIVMYENEWMLSCIKNLKVKK